MADINKDFTLAEAEEMYDMGIDLNLEINNGSITGAYATERKEGAI